MLVNLDTANAHLHPHLSETYVIYLIEYDSPLKDATLSETNITRMIMLLGNQSVALQSIPTQVFLDIIKEFKTVAQLSQPTSKFLKYTVENETSNNMTNILDEIREARNSSVYIVLIPLNQTENATQKLDEFLGNLNFLLNFSARWKYSRVQNVVLMPNETKPKYVVLELHSSWRNSTEYKILKNYVDPTAFLFTLVVGLLGNGILLILFIRHQELRTAPNVMIIHLAICDILNLSINAPLHFLFHYEGGSREPLTLCRTILALRQFLRCTGALAVIALITQRFCIIVPHFRNSSAKHFNVLSIVAVWVLPLLVAIPPMYLPEFYEPICFSDKQNTTLPYVIVLNFVLYCVIMPSIMFGFSTLIAIRLKQSANDMPGELRHRMQEQQRNKTALMMMALAVVFVITYFPFQVWVLLVRWGRVNEHHPIMIYGLYLSKHLLFANGCFNPIALFIVSSRFKDMFVRDVLRPLEQRVYSIKS